MNVTRCFNCPAFDALIEVEDPKVYLDRFLARNIPIIAGNAVADEFFVPEGSQFWFPEYTGEAYLMYIPNAEHSMAGHIGGITDALSAFLHTTIHELKRPGLTWEMAEDGTSWTLTSDTEPVAVKLWQAYNEKDRYGKGKRKGKEGKVIGKRKGKYGL